MLRARFSDAQCGFKAIRASAANQLLPLVRDQEWFFDTELLTLAQRHGLRVHEVPVDWVEDPDSRVRLLSTALGDLAGVARMLGGAAEDPAGSPSPSRPALARSAPDRWRSHAPLPPACARVSRAAGASSGCSRCRSCSGCSHSPGSSTCST